MVEIEIFNEVLKTANVVQKYLLSSNMSGENLSNLAIQYDLSDRSKYREFTILIGDIILGFYNKEDTVALLQQELGLDHATAERLGADVLEFLAPLSDPTWQPPTDEDGEKTENSGPTSHELSPVTLSAPVALAQIEETGHEPSTIPEIRTMAGDMAYERSPDRSTFNAAADFEEPAYVSTQPTIEKKVMDVPSYSSPPYQSPKPDTPNTDARWN